MKHFLLAALLVFSVQLLAQNWAPINSTEQFNYSLNNSDVITHAIKVESVEVNGGDSIFHFNRVFTECDTCFLWLDVLTDFFDEGGQFYNQDQANFIGNRVVRTGDDWAFELNDSTTFLLKPKASILDTWQFIDGQNAIVINEAQENVLGSLDSIKLISVGNGDIIKLSKNHGILEFPELSGSGEFALDGIQERNLETTLLDFEDVYNFDVGDVFLFDFHRINSSGDIGQPGFYKTIHKGILKKTVEEIIQSPTYIQVLYSTVINDTITESVYSSTSSENSIPQSTEISFLAEHSSEIEIYSLEDFADINPIPFGEHDNGKFYQYDQLDDGRTVQYFGAYHFLEYEIERNSFQEIYYYDVDSDTEGEIWITGALDEHGEVFDWLNVKYIWGTYKKAQANAEGLGQVSDYLSSNFPGQDSTESPASFNFRDIYLLAYDKMNGDSGGIMMTDEEVLSLEEIEPLELSVFPNPIENNLTISSNSRIQHIKILNSLGKEVLIQAVSGEHVRLDIGSFNSGFYVVEVLFENGAFRREKIVRE